MNLTQEEREQAIALLQAGKPLPTDYRFKLFENPGKVELVWEGKRPPERLLPLPFQTIECVDEARKEQQTGNTGSLFATDSRGRQTGGWSNKLIWGDNKLVLASLAGGPLRRQIEDEGGLKLIYIDPPFDVGADFSFNVNIGNEGFKKSPSVIEELAYRDTWGRGNDSYLSMIYERLALMRDLLAEDGSIYVHCDWRVNSYIEEILSEIFGIDNIKSEIIWRRADAHNDKELTSFGNIHDYIIYAVKDIKNTNWNIH